MTREEAIEVLENGEWWEELTEWYMVVHPEHDKLHDAVDMAISALRKQETVTDSHQMTNADRIRAMSDEELATFISEIADECERNTECNQHCYGCDIEYCVRESCLKWLHQPAEEDKHD